MSADLVFSNIVARPMRSLATSLAVGLQVALLLLIVGLADGMIRENSKRMAGVGADIALQPPNSSLLLAASTAAMSVKIVDLVSTIEGVAAVTPIFLQFNTTGGVGLIWGVDLKSFNQVSQGFIYLNGSGFQGGDDVIIDNIYASSGQLRVDDRITLMNHTFRVSGIVENGKGSRIFIPIKTMQNLVGSPRKSTLMLIKCHSQDDIPRVLDKLSKQLKSYPAFDMTQFVSQITLANKEFGPLKYFTRTVVLVAALIGFFIIFLSMYTAISERTREIGILKSLGATRGYVSFIFLKEALVLTGFGFLSGLGLTLGAKLAFKAIFPSIQHYLFPEWVLATGIVALLSASLGALYPAFWAASQDPIETLTYE